MMMNIPSKIGKQDINQKNKKGGKSQRFLLVLDAFARWSLPSVLLPLLPSLEESSKT